jgi:hypothetical protein
MNTFKKLKLIVFLLAATISIQAQIAVGIKSGVNLADTRVDGLFDNNLPEQTMYPGFTVGVIAEIPLMNGFAFRPELNFVQKGFVTDISITDFELLGIDIPLGARAKTRFNYVDMPLLLKYSTGSDLAKLYFIAGPTLGYTLNAHVRPVANLFIDINLPRVNIPLDNDIYQRWEVAATMGIGGEFKAGQGKIFGDARYNLGLTNMLQDPIIDFRAKNQGIAITAGYAYQF